MANNSNLKPFVKGDPRINRKGRPKSFDALRALAQMIAQEVIEGREGSKMSRVELILRSWSTSGNPQLAGRFMEIAYGKVPEEMKVQGDVKVLLDYENDPYPIQPAAPSPGKGDPEPPPV